MIDRISLADTAVLQPAPQILNAAFLALGLLIFLAH